MPDGFRKYLLFYLFISALSFPLGRLLPARWFYYNRFPYKTLPFENNGRFYERFGIKKWQSKVPDMSKIVPKLMPPKSMAGNYRQRLPVMITETCVAEFTHGALAILGLLGLTMWASPWKYLITGIYILIFNVPFMVIQRYNRPRLVKVYQKLQQKEKPYPCADSQL